MNAKTVFMHCAPGTIEELALTSTPDGFTMTKIRSQASDEEKIEALADAEFLLGFGPFVSEAVLRAAPKQTKQPLPPGGLPHTSIRTSVRRPIGKSHSSQASSPLHEPPPLMDQ